MQSIRTTASIASVLASLGLMLGSPAESHAWGDDQGRFVNDTRVRQSMNRVAGTPIDSVWLQGEVFTGVKPGEDGAEATVITVLGFEGDQVKAYMSSADGSFAPADLHASDLIGVEWIEPRCDREKKCVSVRYRITGATRDRSRNTMRSYSSNDDVWLYELEYATAKQPGPGDWQKVCAADRDQIAKGLFVDGSLDASGTWRTGYSFTCTSGVAAKCIRTWGYKPWRTAAIAGGKDVSLRPLYRSCVRAARADYCGKASFTRDGTHVDLFDVLGLNVRGPNQRLRPEAGFDEDGAVWIERTRWPIGESDRGDHIALPDCLRPKRASVPERKDALITIWSDPGLGRPVR